MKLTIKQLINDEEMRELEYHAFSTLNELRDLHNDHQQLLMSQRDNLQLCIPGSVNSVNQEILNLIKPLDLTVNSQRTQKKKKFIKGQL